MNRVKEHHEPLAFAIPENVEWRAVEPVVEAHDEEDPNALADKVERELFIRGTAPSAPVDVPDATRLETLENSAFAP